METTWTGRKIQPWLFESSDRKKTTPSPFYIEAEEAALFRWNPEKVDAEHSEKLLKQNAPALLLSLFTLTISLITSASPYAAYDIPLYELYRIVNRCEFLETVRKSL